MKQIFTPKDAAITLRDTPIDIKSTREDDIHTIYATAMMMAIEVLEDVDKYRWHDLRKDPDDLPAENKMCIVAIKSYDGSSRTDFRWFERTKVRGKIVCRWKYPWETITDEEITHWMERPPAAGGEDK